MVDKRRLIAVLEEASKGAAQYDPTLYGTVIESWDFLRSDALFQDSAATTPAGVGDPVGAYVSPFTSVAWTQTTTASKPTRRADGVEFDGTDDVLRCASNAITSTAGSYTLIARYTDDVGTDDILRYLVDVETGRMIFASSYLSDNTISFFDGSWRLFNVAGVAGLQTITYVYDTGNTQAILRRDGTQLASIAAGSGVNIGGRVGIGSQAAENNQHLDGTITRMTLYEGVLSGADLISAETAIAS